MNCKTPIVFSRLLNKLYFQQMDFINFVELNQLIKSSTVGTWSIQILLQIYNLNANFEHIETIFCFIDYWFSSQN